MRQALGGVSAAIHCALVMSAQECNSVQGEKHCTRVVFNALMSDMKRTINGELEIVV